MLGIKKTLDLLSAVMKMLGVQSGHTATTCAYNHLYLELQQEHKPTEQYSSWKMSCTV